MSAPLSHLLLWNSMIIQIKNKIGNQGSRNWIQDDSLDVPEKWLSVPSHRSTEYHQGRNSYSDYVGTCASKKVRLSDNNYPIILQPPSSHFKHSALCSFLHLNVMDYNTIMSAGYECHSRVPQSRSAYAGESRKEKPECKGAGGW